MRIGSSRGWRRLAMAALVCLVGGAPLPVYAGQAGPTSAMDGSAALQPGALSVDDRDRGRLLLGRPAHGSRGRRVLRSLGGLRLRPRRPLRGPQEPLRLRPRLHQHPRHSVAPSALVVGQLGLKADVRQLFSEGFGFYRVASGGRADNPAHLDVLVGARYTASRVRLTAESAAGAQYDGEFQELSWMDAMAGVKGRAPLGSRMVLLAEYIAGFGSQLTWNLEGDRGSSSRRSTSRSAWLALHGLRRREGRRPGQGVPARVQRSCASGLLTPGRGQVCRLSCRARIAVEFEE